ICAASACVGDVPGHVIAIGHDYASDDPAMDRVLANAVGAGGAMVVRVGWWRGAATQQGAVAAAHRGFTQSGRSGSDVQLAGFSALPEIDSIVIEPQVGDGDAAEAAGVAAQSTLAAFLAGGRVVVVLETVGGVSYRFAHGAGLYSVVAPADATGMP